MELFYALMGAVVGGGIAATVAWIQTRVMLRHELDLLRSQLEADREAGRAALRRTAATDALGALATLDACMPHLNYRFAFLGGRVPGYVVERRRRAELAMAELRRVEVASIPLLGEGIEQQWRALIQVADEAARKVEDPIPEQPNELTRALGTEAEIVHTALVELIQKD